MRADITLSSLNLPALTIVRGSLPYCPAHDGDPGWKARLDQHGRVAAYTRATDGGGWVYLPGLAGYRFAAGAARVEAFPEPGAPADTITEGFHRSALPLALQATTYEVLHASAVRDATGVHVFCGASAAGKSTVAYALRRRGFEVWADDAVAFTVSRGEIIAVPLPFSLRIRGEVARFFEEPGHVHQPLDGKMEVLRNHESEPLPVASVSLLERGPAATISRLAAEALPAVLYHSFYFSLDEASLRRRMANQFLDLVARVPVFRVSLRPGLEGVDGLLDDLESRVLRNRRARSTA